MGDSDKPFDWRDKPVSTHVLILANGTLLKIHLYYDQSETVHCDGNEFKLITDLNDLSSIFEQLNPAPNQFLTLMLCIDDFTFEIPNWNSGSARFRFGPPLAHATGESRVEGCASAAILDSSQSVVDVRIKVEVLQFPGAVYRGIIDHDEFAMDCAWRGVETEAKDNVMVRQKAPVEILSLHSSYFCTLFYGQGFAEKSKLFIEIKNVDRATIRRIIQIAVIYRYMTCFNLNNRSEEMLRALDRFGCIRQLEKVKLLVKMELSRTNARQQPFSTMIELSDIMEDQQIMVNYLERFLLPECLNSLVKENVDLMTQTATLLLTQRLTSLSKNCYSRDKIKIIFNEGEVVCTLFRQPANFPDLAGLVRSGSLAVDHNTRAAHDAQLQVTCFKLGRPLPYAANTPVICPPYFASKPLLLQGYLKNHSKLYFSKQFFPNHLVFGVVISGQDLIQNITVPRSISIAN